MHRQSAIRIMNGAKAECTAAVLVTKCRAGITANTTTTSTSIAAAAALFPDGQTPLASLVAAAAAAVVSRQTDCAVCSTVNLEMLKVRTVLPIAAVALVFW